MSKDSPQRLTGLDTAFLALENRFSQMHTLKFAVLEAVDADRPLTPEAVMDFLRRRVHAVPCYSQKLRTLPFGLHHPVFVAATDFDPIDHMHVVTVPAPGGRRERDAVIADICGRKLDRRRPLWELWILDGLEGGRIGALTKLHHTLADGRVSTNQILAFAAAPDADLPAGTNTVTYFQLIVSALADRLRDIAKLPALIVDTRRTMRATRRIRGAAPVAIPGMRSAPPTPFDKRASEARTWGTASLPLVHLRLVAKYYQVSINDVLLAMFGTAVRNFLLARGVLPEQSIPATLPVDTSTSEHAGELQGNRWSALTTTLATDEPDIVERLRTISVSMDSAKEIRNARGDLLERWAQYLNLPLMQNVVTAVANSSLAERSGAPVLGTSNVRGPDSIQMMGDFAVSEFYSVGPINHAGMNVTAWSYAGQFNMSLLAGRNVVADPYEILDSMRDGLHELAVRAGIDVQPDRKSDRRTVS